MIILLLALPQISAPFLYRIPTLQHQRQTCEPEQHCASMQASMATKCKRRNKLLLLLLLLLLPATLASLFVQTFREKVCFLVRHLLAMSVFVALGDVKSELLV